MLASRAVKPKLTLSISTATQASTRPSLSYNLPSPAAVVRSPISPSPVSPTARNTRLNQRGYSTVQQANFAYKNYSSRKSILKKGDSGSSRRMAERRLQFREEPTVHAITPIEAEDCESEEGYYGSYGAGKAKMSRDERRWGRR